MFDVALSSLVAQLVREWNHPHMLWQALILAVILGVAKLAERSVQNRHLEDTRRAVLLGHGGLKRLVFPLVALGLTMVARVLLGPLLHVNLFSLAVPLLGSMAVIRFVFFVLRVTFRSSLWIKSFERVFATTVWFVVALHITGYLPEVIDLFKAVSFSAGKQTLSLWMILQGLLVVAATLLVALWLGGMLDARLARATELDGNLQVAFSRLAQALLVLLAIMISLPAVGIDLTALSVFGGALGVGLGFGLQKIASNYVSGFIILLERSIRIGNLISVGADKGRVAKITTRYTVLRAGNGVESLIPNEALVSGTVQSETYSDTRIRHTLPVQIAYQDNPAQAIDLLESIARNHPAVAVTPPPQAFLSLFADSGINLELQYWVESSETNGLLVRSAISIEIWKAFAEAGISFPYPQREVRLLSTPEYDKSAPKPLFGKG
jgi:small-conductance mechanosensitive channel